MTKATHRLIVWVPAIGRVKQLLVWDVKEYDLQVWYSGLFAYQWYEQRDRAYKKDIILIEEL